MEGKEFNEKELKETMQYWWSKYCNTLMRPEREAYLGVYNALKVVYELKFGKSPARIHAGFLIIIYCIIMRIFYKHWV